MDRVSEMSTPPEYNRVADECLNKLCQTFCEQCPPTTELPLPSKLDDISLACLLIAEEWGSQLPETTTNVLGACLAKVAGRFWGDRLPWQLALQCCQHNPRGAFSLESLTDNLSHSNSNVRLWMFDLAWCVQKRLDPVEASVLLLKNVADTLGYWDSSLGLCRTLFSTDDEFFGFADNFQPEDFAGQYEARLKLAREKGLAIFQQRFARMELRLNQIINETAAGIMDET